MKIAIVIPTYKKSDGSSKFYLTRALESIKKQSFKDYKVFLIGDKYDDNEELNQISKIIDNEKIIVNNLSYAYERDKYINNPDVLWTCGGVNAVNIGISMALNEGFEYIAHLDHDDYWYDNHLYEINNVITNKQNVGFVYTLSKFINDTILPRLENNGEIVYSLPKHSNLVHSSTCINFKKLKARYRNMFEEFSMVYPSDAALWNELNTELKVNNINSFLIKKITCVHDKENEKN
jgi:hypothetical protein